MGNHNSVGNDSEQVYRLQVRQLRDYGELSKTTVDGFGQNRAPVRDRLSISPCRAIFRLRTNWLALD
jgi:hypothetical protein